jgi:CHAD domain-containing protein
MFKRRLDAFDALRDTQVQLLLLKALRTDFPEVRELDAWLRRREGKLIADLRKGIRAAKPARLEKRLKALEKILREFSTLRTGSQEPSPINAALDAAFTAVVTLHRAVRRRNPATIHRTRIAFKRYRYMAELLRPFLPGVTAELRLRMRRHQTRMGDIQDMEVLLAGLALAEKKDRLEAAPGRRLRFAVARRRNQLVDDYLQSADELVDFDPSRLLQPAGATRPTEP